MDKAIDKSLKIAEAERILARTYWAVLRTVPKRLEGEERVAMTLLHSKEQPKPVVRILQFTLFIFMNLFIFY